MRSYRKSALILFTLFFISPSAGAVEIDELEEITMQLVDPETIPNIKIQQLITIPTPAPAKGISVSSQQAQSIKRPGLAISKPREASKKSQ
ncbi:MAG: hypothetical protein R3240_07695 [Gammaproteobacteria bacterium]|nr:hypothetical protein [Gammaproteobacteria bacterium]